MADTTFTNGVTLTDAEWFNDVNDAVYTPTLNARRASTYVFTAWDPTDVAGAETNASSSSSATSTATDFVTVANSSGTLTFTCVKAGVYRFTINMHNEAVATATQFRMRATVGGTGTVMLGTPTLVTLFSGVLGPDSGFGSTAVFYATMTAAQTVTILPKISVVSGGVTTNFTQQCTVSAEYTGAS